MLFLHLVDIKGTLIFTFLKEVVVGVIVVFRAIG